MKKNLTLFLAAAFALVMTSCGGEGGEGGEGESKKLTEDAVVGKWKVTALEDGDGRAELEECEKETVFEFSKEADEVLADGTETMKATMYPAADCDAYFNEDPKEMQWTMHQGKLFMQPVWIGGTSFSGSFKVESFDGKKLVLKIFETTMTMEKQ